MGGRLRQARQAWRSGDRQLAAQAHQQHIIQQKQEPHQQERGRFISEAVYGGIDGIVTTFAVVAGVSGAALSPAVVLVLGVANLLADGLSMGAGAFLGAKSEADYHRQERLREEWEIEHFPEGEREEIREIYRAKGFEGDALEQAVEIITADRERWVQAMMVEELGILEERKNPLMSGLVTLLAFLIAGTIPLVSYLGSLRVPMLSGQPFAIALAITMLTIFALGSVRSLLIYKKWWVAGLEMLSVGGLTAIVAYGIGAGLGHFVPAL